MNLCYIVAYFDVCYDVGYEYFGYVAYIAYVAYVAYVSYVPLPLSPLRVLFSGL